MTSAFWEKSQSAVSTGWGGGEGGLGAYVVDAYTGTPVDLLDTDALVCAVVGACVDTHLDKGAVAGAITAEDNFGKAGHGILGSLNSRGVELHGWLLVISGSE